MGITMVLSLLSGVALFLYGMALMGDSLKKVAGDTCSNVGTHNDSDCLSNFHHTGVYESYDHNSCS